MILFPPDLYRQRRTALARALPGALIVLPGNAGMPMDFAHNHHAFVQDGCFRYFFGLDRPDLVGLIDGATGESHVYGDDGGLDSAIWLGPVPRLVELALQVGADGAGTLADCATRIGAARGALAWAPPYSAQTVLTLSQLTGMTPGLVTAGASLPLVQAIVAQREIKTDDEIAEMESALAVTARMHHAAMAATRPGVREHEVVGVIEGIARGADLRMAYAPILSGRGEVLHNLRYDRTLAAGELVVNDSGVKSPGGYASDITRTFPVSGRFDPVQRRLYDAVLRAQQAAIAACRPGVRYLDLHWLAARVMVEDLHDFGLFRGSIDDVLESGAYAVCFPCGLGHQIGLDVHDMEALGEDNVGYDGQTRRSTLFGLNALRMAKPLRAGMTVTIEPGLYFIPALIDRWRDEGRHAGLIDYAVLDGLRTFGGIRIEDDVCVTRQGSRVMGPPIARTVDEVEAAMRG
jgi:Xaa-Pro aminopeptidase